MSEGRVLLVDDEEEYLEALSERMGARGLDVSIAQDGAAGLELAASGSFDIVFLDMSMPGMDGIETLKKLKSKKPDLEVVFVTGEATVEKVVAAMKLGALDLVEKPVDIDTLMDKVKKARTDRLILIEKRSAEKIKKILAAKGW